MQEARIFASIRWHGKAEKSIIMSRKYLKAFPLVQQKPKE